MMSLISLCRGLWQKFQTAHPVIRWGGAILASLVVLELIYQEGLNLYIQTQTARAQIEQANQLSQKTAAEKREAEARAAVARDVAAGEKAKADAANVPITAQNLMLPAPTPVPSPNPNEGRTFVYHPKPSALETCAFLGVKPEQCPREE
jgi:hypothetical protein